MLFSRLKVGNQLVLRMERVINLSPPQVNVHELNDLLLWFPTLKVSDIKPCGQEIKLILSYAQQHAKT